MSRGIGNEGFEMDSFSSTHRHDEGSLPGQVDDRYYQDQDYRRRRNSYDRDLRHEETHPYKGNGDNSHSDHRSKSHHRNRDNRGIHNRTDNGGTNPRDERDINSVDEIEMRLQKFKSSSKEDNRRQDPQRLDQRGARNVEGMDEIEERLKRYKSSSDNDTGHSPPRRDRRKTVPKSEGNPDDIEERMQRFKSTADPEYQARQYGERSDDKGRGGYDDSHSDWGEGHNAEYIRPPVNHRNMSETEWESDVDIHDGSGGRRHYSHPHSFRDQERDDLQRHRDHDPNDDHPNHGGRRQSRSSGWGTMMQMLPSQMDRAAGTLRFRGAKGDAMASLMEDEEDPTHAINNAADEDNQPKTKTEVLEQLVKLREQPWPMRIRRQRKAELKIKLESMGANWYSVGPVISVVETGKNKINEISNTLDPLYSLLKRIEGKHGASVVAVFNFIRDMIRLNFVLALLLLAGIVIPSSFLVDESDQAFGWRTGDGDLCAALQLDSNSTLQDCNQNYTDKVATDVELHSTQWLALLQDFLQGTGFLEWTILFSGYYSVTIESGRFLVSLAYLLTVLVTYLISLVFVVRFVAKFLKTASSSTDDFGMTFSKIVFTGWDFTVKEAGAAKIESSLFVCEVKAAFDEEEHTRQSLQRTRNDNIKLYFGRIMINLIIMTLIGGSWAGIYFLVIESQKHMEDTALLQFIWEYAPTLTVAGLNLIFPMVFTFLVTLEKYKGSTELFVTLSRCVLVRLTSLGILIITKIGLINSRKRTCNRIDEFICWETHLGQQVYSILILDAIIQLGMNLVVNVLRRLLRNFNNGLCKTLGTIEFFVPGHVLDVVYIQAVCWIGVLYSPLIVTACLLHFCLTFFLKLFTVSVTCVPASRVFRSSRSSAMFMTILALAFLICLIPNALALLYLQPSLACSPFRGLGYGWQALIYYICHLSGSSYWIRSIIFALDGAIVCTVLLILVFLAAVYYISIFSARGEFIKQLETKLKNANKDKNYLMEEFQRAQGISAEG